MLRIPLASGRVECRAADISCNVYLGAALMLAAGLEGIREGLDPGEPHAENMYLYSDAELAAKKISYLPRSLGEAIDAFEADPLAEKVFGPVMFKAYRDYKRNEWHSFQTAVTDWERARYLKHF